ncbi:Fis family transcriptional regulator [Bradyrhizobium sp. Y36]|uniref:UvrD-helicase domain-containing protein n=1 Tax=Bradyrhizobium sp. Y36 TaxID=2035447 RepID=UPI000BE8B142|nr:UvrD-helicase domain-containing protein [Bradyrhizobium sp. Y36]PDT82733.1 Fis family transcriptional regulator [Bradyrhizobium sp. Y36]
MPEAAAANSNVALDEHIDEEISDCLDLEHPRSFFLYAGAGSGKTSSLIRALEFIKQKNLPRLRLRGQQVAVVTYTNAACDEILRRLKFDPTFHVSTIHSFAWKLISGFNKDIRDWLHRRLESEIRELREQETKGRPGTKASVARQAQIESKSRRLAGLSGIRKFSYSPTGDNKERDALNHAEVIALFASFLAEKKLMQSILVNQFPFLLVDESQDTNKQVVDALLTVQATHTGKFSLGFIGDTMQRIYNDGKERIEEELPSDWAKPVKRLNHRCPRRIVRLINQIRSQVDGRAQEARSDSIDGIVRLFILKANEGDKSSTEDSVRAYMSELTHDADWNDRQKCKILTLEHHMAARRMGFEKIFEALASVDTFRTGFLDGSLSITRLFTANVLPLISALQGGDKFATAKIMREFSPLLTTEVLKNATDQRDQLRKARDASEGLLKLWQQGVPTCGTVLSYVAEQHLFDLPEALKPFARLQRAEELQSSPEDESRDPLDEEGAAIENFLLASFAEIAPYAQYISNTAEFGTHQGVKGLEFDRVMVLMDDSEARGFMFGYEKFFGAKELSPSDLSNESQGRDSSVSRTRRLFYVTCSRAKKSLALVLYTSSPEAVKMQMLKNEWFDEHEILSAVPDQQFSA